MRATMTVRELTMNDGQTVLLPEKGVLLIVGPNNSGKSQALRDVSKLLTSRNERGVVVSSAAVDYVGNSDDLLETLKSDRTIVESSDGADQVALGNGKQALSSVLSWWSGNSKHIVGSYFMLLANTEERLNASKPAAAMNLYSSNPSHPLHRVYVNREIEARLDKISREAFSSGLILDTWAGGNHWALRVGEISPPDSPRPPEKYLDQLRDLPLLHEQGDGVRSMLGLLLELFTGHQSIALIDEPEAFLHPPQARYLARLLSQEDDMRGTTTLMSTHSSEIVHGVLEGSAPTTVVRLTREGSVNRVAVLDNAAVRKLWSDPLLRYSNLLEGLFTDAVIVCESEADCKYYASIRDTLDASSSSTEEDGESATRRLDLLFTNCGGKHRMHSAVEALRAASVPVAVIGDFDVLNDWGVLSRIIKSAGGEPSSFEADWRVLNSALTSSVKNPSKLAMRESVLEAFDGISGSVLTRKEAEAVRGLLKIETGWDRVKNGGLADVPPGDATIACTRILDGLKKMRIHLVPIGEMEDFVRVVGGHGGGWLAEVLERKLHETSDSDRARLFLEDVIGTL